MYFLIAILLNLSSCDSTRNNLQQKNITFSQSNQHFEIVPFYLNMSLYVEKARENRDQINQIYKTYVFDPIWDDFASKGECSFLVKNIKNPITDLEQINTEIIALSKSGVEEIIKNALLKVSKVLPGPNTTVYIQVLNPAYKKMFPSNAQNIINMGIQADTYGTGKIIISIEPTSKNWRKMLPRIVAHEYHHSVWVSRNFVTNQFRLLDCLILEGRAEVFADLLYPNIEAPWPEIGNEENRVWLNMKRNLMSKDEHLILKMFTGDKEIPFLGVYSMGYRIMQEFLKNNPDVSLIEWTDMKPEEILSKSRYEDKFN